MTLVGMHDVRKKKQKQEIIAVAFTVGIKYLLFFHRTNVMLELISPGLQRLII